MREAAEGKEELGPTSADLQKLLQTINHAQTQCQNSLSLPELQRDNGSGVSLSPSRLAVLDR